ncbi:hypothetical protein BJX99DRAFT_263485 [Aspergillus californicus]
MSSNTPLDKIPDGYPKLAAFISKDKEYAVFRKFQALNTRNLLYLQSELSYLETKLEQHDAELAANSPDDLKSWPSFRADTARMNLIIKIRKTLAIYNEALVQYDRLTNLGSPELAQIQGLKSWIDDTTPIVDASGDYLERKLPWGDAQGYFGRTTESKLDLVGFKRDQDSWLSGFFRNSPLKYLYMASVQIARLPVIIQSNLEQEDLVFLKKTQSGKDTAVIFFPSSKVESIVTASAVLLSVALTVSAIAVLNLVKTDAAKVSLVAVFSLLVACSLAITGAKKGEVMIGTIGYAAVLVVFVSNQK